MTDTTVIDDANTEIQTQQNDKYPSIIDLAIDANPAEIATTFDLQIKDIIASNLEDRKVELAQNLFGVETSEENDDQQPDSEDDIEIDTTDDEEDDLTDDEINQLSDEEWDELITQLETEDDEPVTDEDEPTEE